MPDIGDEREMTHEEFLAKHMMQLTPVQLSDMAALLRYVEHRAEKPLIQQEKKA